jgi:hypothetical protein
MGGLGSGALLTSCRRMVEDTLAIDVRDLARAGYLMPASTAVLRWPDRRAAVRLEAAEGEVALEYVLAPVGVAIVERIALDTTPCHLGGERLWFLCPRCPSAKRVARLYFVDGQFACRTCNALLYASQYANRLERARLRLDRAAARIGPEVEPMAGKPRRPRGMWRSTFDRLCDDLLRARASFHAALDDELVRIKSYQSRLRDRGATNQGERT